MDNTRYWNALAKTDPAHTKRFKRAGGFQGTAIKPIYADLKMTQAFGPCGIGWGYTEPQFQIVPVTDGEQVVYCWVGVWYADGDARSDLVWGVGGDFVVKKNKYGLTADDEAFKKAFTDAIGNAMKHLGMSADVHMGQHDDDKYVTELRREFSAQKNSPPQGSAATKSARFEMHLPGEPPVAFDRAGQWLAEFEKQIVGRPDLPQFWEANKAAFMDMQNKTAKDPSAQKAFAAAYHHLESELARWHDSAGAD